MSRQDDPRTVHVYLTNCLDPVVFDREALRPSLALPAKYVEAKNDINSSTPDPGLLSIYLDEDDLSTFNLLVDFLGYYSNVTMILPDIELGYLPSHGEPRRIALIKLFYMASKYQVIPLMEYCFSHYLCQIPEYTETPVICGLEEHVQNQVHDTQLQIHSPMFNDVFWSQDLLPLGVNGNVICSSAKMHEK